jgi:hypothetical protein
LEKDLAVSERERSGQYGVKHWIRKGPSVHCALGCGGLRGIGEGKWKAPYQVIPRVSLCVYLSECLFDPSAIQPHLMGTRCGLVRSSQRFIANSGGCLTTSASDSHACTSTNGVMGVFSLSGDVGLSGYCC